MIRHDQPAWRGVINRMGQFVGREAGGNDGVDGEEGEEAVGAFFAVWRADEVFVAEEGVAVCGVF